MAKMFYSLEEAKAKLGCDEPTVKQAVRDGKLREFRDAGKVNYKVDDVDRLAVSGEFATSPAPGGSSDRSEGPGSINLVDTPAPPADASDDTSNLMPDLSVSGSIGLAETGGISLGGSVDAESIGGSATGESVLGLSGSSGLNLGAAGDDIVSLDDDDVAGVGEGDTAAPKSKEDTVVSSVGVSVFDEEDLDESADPLAKTVVSGSAAGGTGLEGVGSGSGLLDLTRESDDTSLGAELLDEIYPGSEDSGAGAAVEMGDATRAGLEGELPEEAGESTDEAFEAPVKAEGAPRETVVVTRTVEYTVDAFTLGASGLVVVALLVMCFSGLAVAAMIRGIWPSILDFVYGRLWMFGLGALVVAGAAMALGVFLGKRSEAS